MPVKIPTVQTGLEASIQAAAKKAGRNLKINMGGNAKSIEGLSQPLGRITGKADQFTKSMEAANARVLAFGASVGVLAAVTRGFQNLIKVTIDVEKSLTSINSILNVSTQQLESFKNTIFDVARNTEQSFSTVAQAALELSRQGLKAEEVTKRLNDSLILSRLSGLGASESVAGLTAAINSFNKSGITSAQVLNKLSAAAVSAAVSERDLIEGIKRSGSVATQAGVSFDELVGVITAVQAKTARGGAVIGNSFKTIFTRIQSIEKLKTMQNLGVEVTDASGQVLGATKLIQNLAKSLEDVPDASRLQIAEGLVGKFQVAPFLAILDDYTSKTSVAIKATEKSQNAFSEAYDRNEAQNKTLSAAINRTTVSVTQFAEALGKIGITDNLKSLLGFFSSVVEDITGIFDGDSIGSKFAKGIVAGIGNIITGPGLAIAAAIIGKLAIDLVKFGVGSLKTFFGLNKAAQQQATLQGQIASTLLGNSTIQKQILAIENSTLSVEQKRVAQTAFFTTALNEQLLVMTRMQSIASKIAPGVLRGTGRGKGRAAGGFIPNYNAIVGYGSEKSDISKGVGGAPASAKPVTIPNFNFGGGQKGTMVANSSEYIVPNYAGGDGSAVFNQDMAASIGLPPRAKKIGAAGGYIPNFVNEEESLVMFAGDRGEDEKRVFHVGQDKTNKTKAYASKPKGKGILTTPVTVPIYRLRAGKGDAEPQDIEVIRKKLSRSSTNTAKIFAKNLSGKANLPNVTEKKIETLFNPGAFEGMSGSIFEVALSSILASRQFLDYSRRSSTSRIDLPYDDKLFSKFGAKGKGKRGSEVKATGSLASGAAEKFYDVLVGKLIDGKRVKSQVAGYKDDNKFTGRTMVKSDFDRLYPKGVGPDNLKHLALTKILGRVTRGGINNFKNSFAGGYIPNFADPLQDAIGREQAAGLPVNQIRVNQSPRLRNAGNPMGLAVTNTRDEPTGAIPNFAKKATPDQATDAMGGFVGKLIAVQMAMSLVSGVSAQVSDGSKTVANSLMALNGVITAAMLGSSFGGLKGIMGGVRNLGSTFSLGRGRGGTMAGKGSLAMMRGGRSVSTGLGAMRGAGAVGAAKGGATALMGGLKVAGGALLRFAGPIGAVAGMALLVNKGLNAMNGSTANVKLGQEALGRAAAAAAIELSELRFKGVREQKEFTDTAASLADGVAKRVAARGFEGAGNDKAQTENIKGLVESVYKAGATSAEVEAIMAKFEGMAGSRSVTKPNIVAGSGFGGYSISGYTTSTQQNEFTSEQGAGIVKELEDLAKKDFSGRQDKLQEFIMSKPELVQNLKSSDKKTKEAAEKEVRDKAIELKVAIELKDVPLDEAEKALLVIEEKITKLKGDRGRLQISTEIELMKIRSQALTSDEKSLALAKRNNSLSQVGIVELQNKIALSKADVEINSSIADLIKEQVGKNKDLVLNKVQVDALTKRIAGTDLKTLSSETARAALLKQTLTDLGVSVEMQEASKGLIDDTFLSIVKQGEARRNNLEATQKQNVLDAESAERINNISKALATASFRKKTENAVNIGNSQRELDRDKQSFSTNNPFIDPTGAAKAEKGFVDRQNAIDIQKKDNEVVEETKGSLLGLINVMPDLEDKIRDVIASIKDIKDIGKAFDFLDQVATTKNEDTEGFFGSQFSANKIPPMIARQSVVTPKAKLASDKARAELERLEAEREKLAEDNKVKGDMAGEAVGMAGAFKKYSDLLREFTNSLRESAEQLKMGLLTAQDAGSIIGNIDNQISVNDAIKDPTKRGVATASDNAALRVAGDKITLARTSVERRAAVEEKDILDQQLKLKTEAAVLDEDEIKNSVKLRDLRDQILKLEKKKSEIGTSRAELFKNEFVFTQEEIQEGLDKALVQNARTFVDTISDGLVNAISKGQDLGDTLRQAGAAFFNSMAQDNMKAAFDNITSSSFVKDIASRFGGNKKAAGGKVTGGSGSKDDVPALLMGGEFVMRKSSVQKYGPSFMESLNSGKIPAMARGGLFTPGTYGQEEIKGKSNLIDFATQSFTSGASDKFGSGSGFASVGLEPQSAALTMFGRRNSPAFKREQDSKKEAFGLFLQQVKKEEEARKQKEEAKKAFKNALVSAAAGAAFKGLTEQFSKPAVDPVPDWAVGLGRGSAAPIGAATGGAIPNKAGVDTVPAMLSGGEFVMNAAATQKIGAGNLNALNSGAGGGSEDIVSKLDELISVSDNARETVINITVNSDGSSDTQGGDGGGEQQQSLATRIKDVVKQVIDDEKRLGGSLRQARA